MPPTHQPLPNPAGNLAAIVSQLYQLAGNSEVSSDQRQALILKAHDLRGDLITMVSIQFSQNSAAYNKVMAALESTTTAITSAEANIEKIIDVESGVGTLAASIDNLLQEAAQIAAAVG